MTKPSIPLRRYVEWLSRGRFTGRVVYVTREWDIPPPQPGAEWQMDKAFDAGEALRLRPELKPTLVAAIKEGAKIVEEHTTERGTTPWLPKSKPGAKLK